MATRRAQAPKKPNGRPPFVPTKAQREKVTIGAMTGVPLDDMAVWLGISTPTLMKHFRVELTTGVVEKKLEVMSALTKAAKRGNVSAAKTLMAYQSLVIPREATPDEIDAAEKKQRDAVQSAPAPQPGPPLGKKDQAAVDARVAHVGSEWGDILPPPALQ